MIQETTTKKQLLIFDLDGTLIDSVPDITVAVNATFTDLGKKVTFSDDNIRSWVGNGSRKLIERALLGTDINGSERQQPDNAIWHTEDEIDIAHDLFLQHYAGHSAIKTMPYEHVSHGLQLLAEAGFVMALVTNKPIQFVPDILRTFGWAGHFKMVLGGDSCQHKKPDPTQLNHVLTTLNIPASEAYMIGDSKNDIQAGQNAGMDTIGLSYGYNYGQDIREFAPTEVFDNFADMVAFLRLLASKISEK